MKETNDEKILCQNIKFLRQKHKLTKTQMSNILGISIRTLNRIENGILPSRISCEVLFRIQSNFGIRARELFQILT